MWRWTYTRYSRVADEEQKKKVLGIYIGNFETYTKYSRDADEKKGLNPAIDYKKYYEVIFDLLVIFTLIIILILSDSVKINIGLKLLSNWENKYFVFNLV